MIVSVFSGGLFLLDKIVFVILVVHMTIFFRYILVAGMIFFCSCLWSDP